MESEGAFHAKERYIVGTIRSKVRWSAGMAKFHELVGRGNLKHGSLWRWDGDRENRGLITVWLLNPEHSPSQTAKRHHCIMQKKKKRKSFPQSQCGQSKCKYDWSYQPSWQEAKIGWRKRGGQWGRSVSWFLFPLKDRRIVASRVIVSCLWTQMNSSTDGKTPVSWEPIITNEIMKKRTTRWIATYDF